MSCQIVLPTLFEGNLISAEVILDICNILKRANLEIEELILDEVVPDLLNHLGSFNFYIQDEKDIGMVLESIKSGVFRTMNIKHELQDVTDQLIKIV